MSKFQVRIDCSGQKKSFAMLMMRKIDFIRDKYKDSTGKDFPIADK